jgi:hypothetical protein
MYKVYGTTDERERGNGESKKGGRAGANSELFLFVVVCAARCARAKESFQ